MLAKFPGKCRYCEGLVNVGDEISWGKIEGVRHLLCAQAETEEAEKALKASMTEKQREFAREADGPRRGFSRGLNRKEHAGGVRRYT